MIQQAGKMDSGPQILVLARCDQPEIARPPVLKQPMPQARQRAGLDHMLPPLEVERSLAQEPNQELGEALIIETSPIADLIVDDLDPRLTLGFGPGDQRPTGQWLAIGLLARGVHQRATRDPFGLHHHTGRDQLREADELRCARSDPLQLRVRPFGEEPPGRQAQALRQTHGSEGAHMRHAHDPRPGPRMRRVGGKGHRPVLGSHGEGRRNEGSGRR